MGVLLAENRPQRQMQRSFRECFHYEGGVRALKEIEKAYTYYAKDVYRYLLSLTQDEDLAEELTQENFLRAMRRMEGTK